MEEDEVPTRSPSPDVQGSDMANTPSPSLSEATAPPLPSYEVPEDDYSIITIFIEDYQIIDGQMISLREDNHPPRDMLFDEKTPARGHHKEIFMVCTLSYLCHLRSSPMFAFRCKAQALLILWREYMLPSPLYSEVPIGICLPPVLS
jgi:hypothetical protein